MAIFHRRTALNLLPIGCLALLVACASDANGRVAMTAAADDGHGPHGSSPRGTVVAGPRNITAFRPDDTSTAVNAASISLKDVFEDIGEDGILWYQHVQTLANPYFEGRVNGSRGTERAREYMEWFFRFYGLQPAFPEPDAGSGAASAAWTSYRQPFEFTAGRRTRVKVDGEHAAIAGRKLEHGDDFVVLGNSGDGSVEGPVTFVGYGIADGVDGYSSFDDDTDLSGRIALLLRYEPLDDDGHSRWSDERFSPNAGIAMKMRAVARRGASGIILVNPPDAVDGASGLESLRRSSRFGRSVDVPAVQMTPEAAAEILAASDAGGDLMAWRRKADDGAVTTADLDGVVVSFGAEVERSRGGEPLEGENVGAVLPGRGRLTDEWLVIGGHYDHNGWGSFGTSPESGPLFPGADDNASGTAGILVLAKMLAERYEGSDADEDLRSVLFIAFDAEERGLHGSRYYSENTTVDPEHMTALLNMDMIGRLRSDNLSVLGVGTAVGLEDALRPHFERSGLTVSVVASGSGRSDDANFNRMGVPAMHFFTGMHPEYTSPADQAYTVNPVGASHILDLMFDISEDFVTRRDQFECLEADRRRPAGRRPIETEPRPEDRDRGYAPVRLGIQPGMNDDRDTGILVEAVSADTSAADAGMQPGDVMLRWDDTELDSMGTLVDMLRSHKPGDRVRITVLRDGREEVLMVRLKAGGGRTNE
jgi:hypothetical protein